MATFDLLVIGGGINGLGVAADASARGLSTVLVEKADFGGGTTSASSRLIHGGLRYLEHADFSMVRESLRERGILARRWPHLIRPIRLLIPAYCGQRPGPWKIGAGLRLYDAFARDDLFPRARRLSPREVLALEPDLEPAGMLGGFAYGDGQLSYPERLCVELLRESRAAGCVARNHCRVVELLCEGDRVQGARVRDEISGAEEVLTASVTVNAAGPWVDVVNRLLRRPPPALVAGTSGSHVVLPVRPGGPRGALYCLARRDGRPVFLLPWDERLLVGTTEVPFAGSPDDAHPEEWETGYLLEAANRHFPQAEYGPEDVLFRTIGVRPLPAARAGAARMPGGITRRHFLVDHSRQGLRRLASMVGGKLTTFRSFAETTVDWCLASLGRAPVRCPTRDGGEGPLPELPGDDAENAAVRAGLPPGAGARLSRIYGGRSGEVLALLCKRSDLGTHLAAGSPAVRAEVVHAVQREGARTVDDVLLRRLMRLPPDPAERAAVGEMLAHLSPG